VGRRFRHVAHLDRVPGDEQAADRRVRDLSDHLPGGDLRGTDRVGDGVDGRARHVGLLEQREPLGHGTGAEDRCEHRLERVDAAATAIRRAEAVVLGQLRMPDDGAQARELIVVPRADHEQPAVAGQQHIVRLFLDLDIPQHGGRGDIDYGD
jgi:hypothetical protein